MTSNNLRKTKTSTIIRSYTTRPRVVVYKSLKYDYVQLVDDAKHKVICGLTTKKIEGKTRSEKAGKLGTEFANVLKKHKINEIAFDRRGYKYHGRIKAIAEAMRKEGINF